MIEINSKYVEGIVKRFQQPLIIRDIPEMPKKLNNYMKLEGFE
jgi:hypothetical protein